MPASATFATASAATALATPEGLLVAGLLSGTSCDGIDVVLARLRLRPDGVDLEPPQLVCAATMPFEELAGGAALRARLLALIEGRKVSLAELACAHRDLAQAFSAALHAVEARHGLRAGLVGSHGQTIWHHDGDPAYRAPDGQRATLQIGDLSTLAARSGRPVVGDFRWADIAAGGEGAPLVALVDHLLFPDLPRPAAILNLGGIANLTILGEREEELLAFDTGPANCVLDTLARELLGTECDRDGALAAKGRVDPQLLANWLAHPYFRLPPPKSTGRDTFSRTWVASLLEPVRRDGAVPAERVADLFATATELVARSVGEALARYAPARAGALLVAGGGAHNPSLMRALERHCGAIAEASAAGPAARAREGLLFAILAARHACGIPSTRPGATGARLGGVLGLAAPAPADAALQALEQGL